MTIGYQPVGTREDWVSTARRYLAAAERGRKRTADGSLNRMRALGTGLNPVGAGDEKTGVPGTYRPVGPTCPDSCAQKEACYALVGNVALHQRRSDADPVKGARTALAAVIAAHVGGHSAARLHVSGDFGRTDDEVDAYARALLGALRAARIVTGRTGVMAWTYTHHPRVRRWVGLLKAAGLHVRYSDVNGPNGAIVVDRFSAGTMARVRAEGTASVAKCPAQLRNTTCDACTLCWTRPDVTIAFAAHGPLHRRASVA